MKPKSIGAIDITYNTDNNGIGIAIEEVKMKLCC